MPTTSALLRETADRVAITDVLNRYATGIDRHDEAMYRSCFLPDAEFVLGGVSRRGEEFLDRSRRLTPEQTRATTTLDGFEQTTHSMSDILVELDGDNATAQSMVVCFLMGTRDGERAMVVRGVRYEDELVRRDDEWKIARRHHRFLWMFDAVPSPMPAEE